MLKTPHWGWWKITYSIVRKKSCRKKTYRKKTYKTKTLKYLKKPPKNTPKLHLKQFRTSPRILQKWPPKSAKNLQKSYLKKSQIPKIWSKILHFFLVSYYSFIISFNSRFLKRHKNYFCWKTGMSLYVLQLLFSEHKKQQPRSQPRIITLNEKIIPLKLCTAFVTTHV